MKTKTSKFVWIVIALIIIAITIVLLFVPLFTVDLDLKKCSNRLLGQISEQLNDLGLDDGDVTEAGCIPNNVVLSLDFVSYCASKGFDIDTLTEDQIPSGDVIKVSNLGIGDGFHTVSFNVRKLFKIDDENLTKIKLKKNLVGTIYRYY